MRVRSKINVRHQDHYDVAIVGAGIAGLYAAFRLGSDPKFKNKSICLFEASDRLGGRMFSLDIPHVAFPIELGAMRFKPTHRILQDLVKEFGVETVKYGIKTTSYHLRGKSMQPHELLKAQCEACGAPGRYILNERQRSAAQDDLIGFVIRETLDSLEFPELNAEKQSQIKKSIRNAISAATFSALDWLTIKHEGCIPLVSNRRMINVHLYDVGFWNLLYHSLGNEAFHLIHDSLGYESIVCNWNAADAIPWFLADFEVQDDWYVPSEGFTQLVERMAKSITAADVPILTNHKLREIRRDSGRNRPFELLFEVRNRKPTIVSASKTILALPRVPLERVKVTAPGWLEEQMPSNIPAVEPHKMTKIFLIYETPWWNAPGFLDHDSGKTITDLPLRQVYYFGPEWIKEHAPTSRRSLPTWSFIMASYSDDWIVDFWSTFTSVQDPEQVGDVHFRTPHDWGSLTEDERLRLGYLKQSKNVIRERMILKVRHQLAELHSVPTDHIPIPIIGMWMNWGHELYGGGWHTWGVHRQAEQIAETMIKPIPGLHICGEAYSTEQGWIEGALRSAERILHDFFRLPLRPSINPEYVIPPAEPVLKNKKRARR